MSTITVTFDPPAPSDDTATFNTKAFATLGQLNTWSGQANTVAGEVNTNASTATTAASTATTQAGIATSAASTATTKAGEASTSAAAAAASAASITAQVATATHGATDKATPVDADELPLADSAATYGLKKLTWANLKATLATWLTTLTATWSNKTLTSPVINGGAINNATVGATTPSTGAFTTVTASGQISATTNTTTPADGSAYFYKSGTGATVSGFQVIAEVGSAGSRSTVGTFSSTGLAVTGALSATGALSFTGTGTGASGAYWAGSNGSNFIINTPTGSGVAFFQNNTTQAMTLDSSARLMVNVSNPYAVSGTASQLSVVAANASTYGMGIAAFGAGTLGASLRLFHNNTGSAGSNITVTDGSISGYGAGLTISSDGNPTHFFTGGSERARIDTSGNLLVGTSSLYGSERLSVSGGGGSYLEVGRNTNASPYGKYIKYTAASPNGVGFEFLVCEDSTAIRANIRSNGGIANYQANNANLSDERLKKDFAPAKSYYSRWRDIEIVTFLYKDQTDTELNLGVKAQQLESVFPELIDNSGFGTAPEGEAPYKAVYQTDFQYATAKALQEAIAEIEQLKADKSQLLQVLASVDNRLAALEAK